MCEPVFTKKTVSLSGCNTELVLRMLGPYFDLPLTFDGFTYPTAYDWPRYTIGTSFETWAKALEEKGVQIRRERRTIDGVLVTRVPEAAP